GATAACGLAASSRAPTSLRRLADSGPWLAEALPLLGGAGRPELVGFAQRQDGVEVGIPAAATRDLFQAILLLRAEPRLEFVLDELLRVLQEALLLLGRPERVLFGHPQRLQALLYALVLLLAPALDRLGVAGQILRHALEP